MTVMQATRERVDPRVRRTRALLQDALLALAQERPLDEIAVADIAERATVSRATFYLHYRDRDDLLADVINAIITSEASLAAGTAFPDEIERDTPVPAYLTLFFRDLERNGGLFRQVLAGEGSARVAHEFRERLRVALLDLMRPVTARRPRLVPDDIHAAWLAGAIVGVVAYWLADERPRTARQVATQVWRLAVQPAIRR